jgi:hypothetical protein
MAKLKPLEIRTGPAPRGALGSAAQYMVPGGRAVPVSDDMIRGALGQGRYQGVQATFINPETGQWTPYDKLPIKNGRRIAYSKPDGMPLVNTGFQVIGRGRFGSELSDKPFVRDAVLPREEGGLKGFLNLESTLPVLAAAAPIALAALAPAAAAGAAGAAGTAGTTAAAAAPEIGAGLFAGGAETAALGAAPSLTGSAFLGGEAAAAPLSMGALEAANFAAPVIGGAVKPPADTGGLMSWLGAPAAQLAGQAINAGVQYAAADRASEQQQRAAQAAMDEQRRQFDITRQSLAPFVQAGTQALGGFAPYQTAGLQAFGQQQALAGLQGEQAQRQAIGALEASPEYQALARQGEEAILQRASATGGLRGGNVQAALAQFRPAMLQQLIDQQYQRLGGFAGTGLQTTTSLAEMGRSAATQQGSFGSSSAENIGKLLTQQGQAQAGGTLGMARGVSELLSSPAQIYGFQRGLRKA